MKEVRTKSSTDKADRADEVDIADILVPLSAQSMWSAPSAPSADYLCLLSSLIIHHFIQQPAVPAAGLAQQ